MAPGDHVRLIKLWTCCQWAGQKTKHTVMSSLSPPHTILISPQVLWTLVRSSITGDIYWNNKLVKLPPCTTIACIGGHSIDIFLIGLLGKKCLAFTCTRKCFSSIHYRLLPRSIGAWDKWTEMTHLSQLWKPRHLMANLVHDIIRKHHPKDQE